MILWDYSECSFEFLTDSYRILERFFKFGPKKLFSTSPKVFRYYFQHLCITLKRFFWILELDEGVLTIFISSGNLLRLNVIMDSLELYFGFFAEIFQGLVQAKKPFFCLFISLWEVPLKILKYYYEILKDSLSILRTLGVYSKDSWRFLSWRFCVMNESIWTWPCRQKISIQLNVANWVREKNLGHFNSQASSIV